MKKRSISILVAAAVVLGLSVWLRLPRALEPVHGGASQTSTPSRAAGGPLPAVSGEEPSHLADGLDSPSGDIHSDLRILDSLFQQYRSGVHDLNPVGENVDITTALTGRNPLGFAFIPSNHPAINTRGELCDRWGTPFFFHQLSGTQMEIRSAGPDRKLWTADDEVITPGLSVPPR